MAEEFKDTEVHSIGDAKDSAIISNETPQSLEESIRVARAIRESESDADKPYPCGLSRRQIVQMKHTGMPKPDFVSWPEWNGPKKINHRLRLVAELAARGYDQKEIRAVTEFSQSYLSMALNSPTVQTEIKLIREIEFQGLGVSDNIDRLASAAIKTIDNILNDSSAKQTTKLRAAQDILDRKLGRAKQQIEVKGNIVGEFYKLLQQHSNQMVPIESKGKTIDSKTSDDSTIVEVEEIVPVSKIPDDGMRAWLDKEFSE